MGQFECVSTLKMCPTLEDVFTKWDTSQNPLNLLNFHKIGAVDTSESKHQNYDQI